MDPNQIAAWRDYLAGQLHEHHGIETQEAGKAVIRWLRALQQEVAPQAYRVPEAARIRNERRGLGVRPAASRVRSARA